MEKKASVMGVMICSKFVKGSKHFVVGQIFIASLEFLWSQQRFFLSNLC
jgi:hypothetical protein